MPVLAIDERLPEKYEKCGWIDCNIKKSMDYIRAQNSLLSKHDGDKPYPKKEIHTYKQ